MAVEKREINKKNTSGERVTFDIVCEKYADLIHNIFFVQERVGKGGKIIRVYKIRTMEHGADKNVPEEVLKGRKDEIQDLRIISGREWMRKYGIDELPQIINILRGEMKLFGVRPQTEADLTSTPESFQKRYLEKKPGFFGGPGVEPIDKNSSMHKKHEIYLRMRNKKELEGKISLIRFNFYILMNCLKRIIGGRHR